MFDLVTVGDCTMDTFLVIDDATLSCTIDKKQTKLCLNYADKICVTDTAHSVGGNAANVAVGTKKIGINTAIVTELGDDFNGHIIKDNLETANVNTTNLKLIKNRESRYAVILNYQSERTILSSHISKNYNIKSIPKTKWIYYTSLGNSFEKVQKVIKKSLKKNRTTKLAINPGSYQLKMGIDTIKKILPQTDIFFVNKEEAELFVGEQKTIKSTLSALHKLGPKIIVITDSEKGSYASDSINSYHMPTYGIKAIAKTGAGDAYTSGFLSAIINGENIKTAMQYGTANAGGVIQQFGAHKGLLNKKQILAVIKKHKSIKPKKI